MATAHHTTVSGHETGPTMDKDARCKKDKRTLAHFMRITTCLAYLAVALQVLGSGLSSTTYSMEPLVNEAKITLSAQTNNMHRQNILTQRLTTLQTKALSKVSFESHEACLTRGIRAANKQLLGIGFHYPEIRHQAMEWTEETCARLLFVPQAVSRPMPQQVVLNYWTDFGHQCRKYSTNVAIAMKHMVNYVWNGMANVYRRHDGPTPTNPKRIRIVFDYVRTLRCVQSAGKKLPAGIDIKCYNSTICNLTHKRTPGMPSDLSTTSAEEIAQSAEMVSALLWMKDALNELGNVIKMLKSIIVYIASFILGSYASLTYQSRDSTKPLLKYGWSIRSVFGPRISKELLYLLCLQLIGSLTYVLEVLLQPELGIPSYVNLGFGFSFLAIGMIFLTNFLTPSSPFPNVYELVSQVCRLMRDSDAPSPVHEDPVDDISQDIPAEPVSSPSTTTPDSSQASFNFATGTYNVNAWPYPESDLYTEYDSDSDGDCFTPVERWSETGSEWSDVEE